MGKAGSSFKKPVVKKTFTKKDIKGIALICAAIIAAVLIIALLIGTDDFIREKDGVLQMEDNWLISAYSNTGKTGQYYQIGEVGDIEGFTLGTESAQSTMKYFWPTEDNEDFHIIYIGTAGNYEEMADYLSANTNLTAGANELYTPKDITCADRNAKFIYCVTDPAAVAEMNAENADETEAAEDTAEEAGEATEETAEAAEATEETEEVAEETEESPGCIIYACIEYDEERCIYIQVNTVEVVTEEEALGYIDMVGEAITIIER